METTAKSFRAPVIMCTNAKQSPSRLPGNRHIPCILQSLQLILEESGKTGNTRPPQSTTYSQRSIDLWSWERRRRKGSGSGRFPSFNVSRAYSQRDSDKQLKGYIMIVFGGQARILGPSEKCTVVCVVFSPLLFSFFFIDLGGPFSQRRSSPHYFQHTSWQRR